jgi:hypothetical protein
LARRCLPGPNRIILSERVITITKETKQLKEVSKMAKKSRGGRMTAAKVRAAKTPGGKGPIKDRPAGKHIMKT